MNLLGDPEKVCDPNDAIPEGFGESFVALEEKERELTLSNNKSKVAVSYKLQTSMPAEAMKSASDTSEEVIREFQTRKIVFDIILGIARKLLTYTFLKLIFVSIKYHTKYCEDIDFDNLYISKYFKKIDERQKRNGKRSVLPLRKFEKVNLVDMAHAATHTKEETRTIIFQLVQFSLEVITSAFFLTLDHLIVTLMVIIRDNSKVTYIQEGEHIVEFHIEGKGLMARLMRSTLKSFNMHETVSTNLSNEECLPNPSALPTSFYIKMALLYVGIVVLIYESSILLRLRHLLCGYFYRKREKKRIIYLYNSMLRQRRSLFDEMRKLAEYNLENRKIRRKINFFLKLRLQGYYCFDWLTWFRIARMKCLICDSFEDAKFVVCPTISCDFAYCNECWMDLGEKCIVCDQRIPEIVIINFDRFFEEFTFVDVDLAEE